MQNGDQSKTRRQEALRLAEEILSDVELCRVKGIDIARKASRLARLLDDVSAMKWLKYEVAGYPRELDPEATLAAEHSCRRVVRDAKADQPTYNIGTLSELESEADVAATEITASASSAASNSEWAVVVERERRERLDVLRSLVRSRRAAIDNVVGAIHGYVAQRYQELRFGASVESAFEVVRSDVDAGIAEIVPDGLPMLTAAFENAVSENPEDWANAAGTCRRLLRTAADALQPSEQSPRRKGDLEIKMGPDNYVNRLVVWIEDQSTSRAVAGLVTADLEYLGDRLDAVDKGGQKGAHSSVNRVEASRFITGTYLLLGDLLRLKSAWPDVAI